MLRNGVIFQDRPKGCVVLLCCVDAYRLGAPVIVIFKRKVHLPSYMRKANVSMTKASVAPPQLEKHIPPKWVSKI